MDIRSAVDRVLALAKAQAESGLKAGNLDTTIGDLTAIMAVRHHFDEADCVDEAWICHPKYRGGPVDN